MPKVSFIMPAYKRRFLKEAIDSILAQTYRDFELVIVDDKSPENLYEVIRQFPWEACGNMLSDGGKIWNVDDITVRYYCNADNIGGHDLVAAWNHAMQYATGEWSVLASDDDVYMPEYLTEMMRLQGKYPHCDLFHCRLAVIDAVGKWMRVGEERIEYESQIQMVYSRGVLRFWQTAQEFMFRRSALIERGGFIVFPLAWYSDDATWMTLSSSGCVCSPMILFCFRQSGDNISSNHARTIAQKFRASDMFKEWFLGFVKTLAPEQEEDCHLINNIASNVNGAVDELMRLIIRGVPSFREWLLMLRSSSMARQVKRSCAYDRFRWLLALRLILRR